jgi:hypothetical protein
LVGINPFRKKPVSKKKSGKIITLNRKIQYRILLLKQRKVNKVRKLKKKKKRSLLLGKIKPKQVKFKHQKKFKRNNFIKNKKKMKSKLYLRKNRKNKKNKKLGFKPKLKKKVNIFSHTMVKFRKNNRLVLRRIIKREKLKRITFKLKRKKLKVINKRRAYLLRVKMRFKRFRKAKQRNLFLMHKVHHYLA